MSSRDYDQSDDSIRWHQEVGQWCELSEQHKPTQQPTQRLTQTARTAPTGSATNGVVKMAIRKAERRKAKLRLAIAGPSGSGKTYSALLIAFGMRGKIGVIDTESGSADLYADLGEYDIIGIDSPYTITKYIAAINEFEKAGYDTIIIDSLSHAWAGEGGLLEKQGKIADKGTNSFAAWRTITPEHNALVESMLTSTCHVIATMRSKQEYVLSTNEKGKQEPRKLGMAPVQREGMEYEFTTFFDVNVDHDCSSTKDRTGLFTGKVFRVDQAVGKALLKWLNTGSDTPAAPRKVTQPPQQAQQDRDHDQRDDGPPDYDDNPFAPRELQSEPMPEGSQGQTSPSGAAGKTELASESQLAFLRGKAKMRGTTLPYIFTSAQVAYSSDEQISVEAFNLVRSWLVKNA